MSKFDVAARKKNLQDTGSGGFGSDFRSPGRLDRRPAARSKLGCNSTPKSIAALREMSGCLLRQKNVTVALEYLVKAYKLAEAQGQGRT